MVQLCPISRSFVRFPAAFPETQPSPYRWAISCMIRDKGTLPTSTGDLTTPQLALANGFFAGMISSFEEGGSMPTRARLEIKFILVFIALATCDVSTAFARKTETKAVLNPSTCSSISHSDKIALPAVYSRYWNFVKTCDIPGTKGRLTLLSVWVDDYYSSFAGIPDYEEIPFPVLIGPAGSEVGKLAAHFPGEAPLTTTLTFSDYHHNWPYKMTITATTDAEGDAPTYPTLTWDDNSKMYTNKKEKK